MKPFNIIKATGESQQFSIEKLEYSLQRSGADRDTIGEIISDILSWIKEDDNTGKIYNRAFTILKHKRALVAARYSLKNAMMELGPAGYPFERLTGQIFKAKGYDVEVGIVIDGKYVTHEVDVIFTKGKRQGFVECKYYNTNAKNASVQVPLYIRSRVNDIVNYRRTKSQFKDFTFEGWVVTNTKFTPDAQRYGVCSGLKLMSWDFPRGKSLKENLEKYKLFPVTMLTALSYDEKQQLLEREIVTTKQLLENIGLIRKKCKFSDELLAQLEHQARELEE